MPFQIKPKDLNPSCNNDIQHIHVYICTCMVTEEKAAASGGLFQFMRKTKNVRHKPEEEGIYLDDLNIKDMDPEVAKLYFPKR